MRNLGRRKLRTTLTILGITIGIWALVVFGSMANKINALVEGGSTYFADKVSVSGLKESLPASAKAITTSGLAMKFIVVGWPSLRRGKFRL